MTAGASHIRSFVPRRGRMTPTQSDALSRLADRYVLPMPAGTLDLAAAFSARMPVVLDVGFGLGEATAAMAAAEPTTAVLAVEVHTPGIGQLLHLVERGGITNVRILQADAIDILDHHLPPASLAGIRIWFPDPWPKVRHHKRRLVRVDVIELLVDRLADGGVLHLATDWRHYALQMRDLLDACPQLASRAVEPGGFVRRPDWRPETRFERFAAIKGHSVHDLLYERVRRHPVPDGDDA